MISVVIPLYNKQDSIVATLQSVLVQTYTDYEVVIVNDGSTDNSAQVVKEFISSSRLSPLTFRLIEQANGGVSAARNTGIIEAKGEYVAFLDGDDLWDEKYLETLHKLICDYPDAIIYGLGCAKMISNSLPQSKIVTDNRGYQDDIWNNYVEFWTGSTCCRKEELLNIGMFDTRMTHGEDLDVWWRLILLGKCAYDYSILAYYRQDAENRAMHKQIPLDKHIPYYIDKFADARASNIDFRRFYEREIIYRLYPYLLDKRYRKQAKSIAKQIDFKLQKKSLYLRLKMPYTYNILKKIINLIKK